MDLHGQLMGGRGWIERHGIGLTASIVLPVLGLVWWNQTRTSHQIDELKRLVRQVVRMPMRAGCRTRDRLGAGGDSQGAMELGEIYLVNSITNAPGDVGCLTDYATIVLERSDPPLGAIDRLSSMLQLAAYQVDPDDVSTVSSLIDKAEQARRRILESHAGGGQAAGGDSRSDWTRLSHVDPNLWRDQASLSAHLQGLEFISKLDEQGDPPADLKSKAVGEFLRWTDVSQALKQCSYIDNCLARLRKGEDLSSQRAVAIVQAAENATPAFWGLNAESLPAELAKKIGDYPQEHSGLCLSDRQGSI